MAAGNRALSLAEVNPSQTPNDGFPAVLLDLYGEAMDRALGIEKASLSAIVEMNSCALDTCERLADDLLGAVAGAFASCMQAQMAWFALMMPRAYEESKTLPAVAASTGVLGAGGNRSTQLSARSLDHGMDVVIGAGSSDPLPGMTLGFAEAGSPGGQTRPVETERCMDLALGNTAA